MAFANFSPGGYSVTWNGSDLGLANNPTRFARSHESQPISVDLYGNCVVDGVYRGGRVFVMVTLAEWTANIRSAIWPFGADFGAVGTMGRLLSDIAASLVLTPAANTAAAALGNNTFTASKAILGAQNRVEFLLGNVERNIPLLFECLLYDQSGTKRHFALS